MKTPDRLAVALPTVDSQARLVFIINAASGSIAPEERCAASHAFEPQRVAP